MDAVDTILTIAGKRGTIRVEGNVLRVSLPGGMPQEIDAAIWENKPAMLELLDLAQIVARMERGIAMLRDWEERGETDTWEFHRAAILFDRLLLVYKAVYDWQRAEVAA